jgi:hypothetical protein
METVGVSAAVNEGNEHTPKKPGLKDDQEQAREITG